MLFNSEDQNKWFKKILFNEPKLVFAGDLFWKKFVSVSASAHSHSSLSKPIPEDLKNFFDEKDFPERLGSRCDWNLKIIWKNVGPDAVLILSPFNNQVSSGNKNLLFRFASLKGSVFISFKCFVAFRLHFYRLSHFTQKSNQSG